MQDDWRKARNHYLQMLALALGLCAAVALVDPGIGSSVALPTTFFAAVSGGGRFGELTGRLMQWGEALRLAALGAVVQVGVGALGIGVALLAERNAIETIHFGMIVALLAATMVLGLVVALAGLRFGAGATLRRMARQKGD